MASVVPTNALVLCMNGTLDLDTNTLAVMLLKSTYTPNPDHQHISDIVAYECNATGYTGGYGGASRFTIAGTTVTEDTTLNRAVFSATDPAIWGSLGGVTNNTLQYIAVVRQSGGNDTVAHVIAILDFNTTFTTTGGSFQVQWNTSGIFYTQH